MRIATNDPIVRKAWWAIVAVDAVLILVLVAIAALKLVSVGDSGSFSLDPTVTERFIDKVEPSIFKTIAIQLDLTKEGTFASYFGALHFTLAGMLAFFVFSMYPVKRSFEALGWGFIASAFLFLSIDDAFMIHETLESMFLPYSEDTVIYGWLIIYSVPLLAAVLLLFIWFRKTFAPHPRLHRLSIYALSTWIAAILLEAAAARVPFALMRVEMMFEETLEIAGGLLFIYVFAQFLSTIKEKRNTADG